ncbi:MAG TPA: GH3 auxin-responsive promoter family protein [Anaerolineae bacterium]|nr:GH3 auxin-responsive promoter family protein [Anaerolineae bacterium]
MVFTNLLGGMLMRYRVGDLIEIVAKQDDEIGVNIPKMSFYSRADDLIDIGTLARFTETTIWQAIDGSKVKYVEWTARKEADNGEVILHLYLELKESEKQPLNKITSKIRKKLHKVCPEFSDMEALLGNNKLEVTILPSNAFNNYIEAQRQAGADLAHIKPPHMQPNDNVIKRLLEKNKV